MNSRSQLLSTLVLVVGLVAAAGATEKPLEKPLEKKEPKFRTEILRGRVVWLGDGLKRQFGISTVRESSQRTLAVETDQGELFPLVEDLRGRSFRTDERLRGKPLELLVRRYEKHPLRQIIRIYERKDGKKYEVDYWCDVCSIVMFERGFCACCQDKNRLRHRLVEKTPKARQSLGDQPAL